MDSCKTLFSIFDNSTKVEALQVFFAETYPMGDRLQYLELKAQGFSNSAIKRSMNISSDQLGNIRTSVVYWASRLEETGTLVPLRRRVSGEVRKNLPISILYCNVSLRNEIHAKRLKLFLISQGIQCESSLLLDETTTAEVLITDNLELAIKSRSFSILISDCFENLPEIKTLVGCIAVPFSFVAVAAYVKAILKRVEFQVKRRDRILRLGEFEINQTCFRVSYQKQIIPLTVMEFKIVERLIEASGKMVTYGDIEVAAWGDKCLRSRLLNVQVYNIRQKGIPIRSFRGEGYSIANPD